MDPVKSHNIFAFGAVAITFLVGCAMQGPVPPQQISPEMNALLETKQDQKCKSYGAVPGTDAYTNCRLKLADDARSDEKQQQAWAAQQQAEEAQRRAAAIKSLGEVFEPPPPDPNKVNTKCVSERKSNGSIETECKQRTATY